MNTIARRNDSFVMCDPAGAYRILPRTGEARVARDLKIIAMVTATGALVGGVWLALHASVWYLAIFFFIVGAFPGALVGVLASSLPLGASMIHQALSNRRHGRPRTLTVGDRSSPEWAFCDLAWQIGQVGSWRDKTVDPGRRVASIAWSAVERTLDADQQYADAVRAREHPSLRELAEETLAKIDRERDSLKAVAVNLGKVLETARGIDADRRRSAAERAISEQRGLEERELRRRLTGDTQRDDSDVQADRSAGLAAETQAIAGWLGESDRMLRDL